VKHNSQTSSVNSVTTDPAARTVELKLLALMTARDAINTAIADLERIRSRIR
jgi:hypothetical protein